MPPIEPEPLDDAVEETAEDAALRRLAEYPQKEIDPAGAELAERILDATAGRASPAATAATYGECRGDLSKLRWFRRHLRGHRDELHRYPEHAAVLDRVEGQLDELDLLIAALAPTVARLRRMHEIDLVPEPRRRREPRLRVRRLRGRSRAPRSAPARRQGGCRSPWVARTLMNLQVKMTTTT